MQCPNCSVTLSCDCQQKRASDFTRVCTNCIGAYEAKLAMITKPQNKPEEINKIEEIQKAINTTPSNVKVFYTRTYDEVNKI